MTMYRLEMKPCVETDSQSESSTSQRNLDYIQRKINAFKDGAIDGFIQGMRIPNHREMHYYNQGYDFGVVLYNKQQEDSE
tara:strand:+ start:42 stop:281 length:240 start_codon:yes stop_codon:yes gene_type:complete